MIMMVISILNNVLRIATRQNSLVLWQAHYVKNKLTTGRPGLVAELVPMVTRGDAILDTPLVRVDEKGLFVKELEVALLENHADIAVHSIEDVPVEFLQGPGLVTIYEREDPYGAFASNSYDSPDTLSAGSIIGMSSLRHQCQLVERRPNLITHPLHGSVDTHLSKLDNGEYDTIIFTVVGLKRLGLESYIRAALPSEISLLTAGQGTVGTEYRLDDSRTRELFATLDHHETAPRATARRAIDTCLEGGCQVSIGSYTELTDGEIWLRALIDASDGSQVIRSKCHSAPQDAEQMRISLAEELLNNGVRKILIKVYNGNAPA